QRMDVRGTEGMTLQGRDEIADGAAHRYWVAGRLDAAEGKCAVLVGAELAAQVHLGLLGVLILVEADGRGVPHIHLRIGDRVALWRRCRPLPRPGAGGAYPRARSPRRWA